MPSGVNRSMNRFIRRTLYSLKRQYGGRVDVYKLGVTGTDYETGVKTYTKTVVYVSKCIVLPVKIQREIVQTISQISANKAFVYGGTYDAGTRMFILDARDLPDSYEITNDDWLIYDNRRYDIKSITEFEQHTGWVVTGKEVRGVRPEQIFKVSSENILNLEHTLLGTVGPVYVEQPSSVMSLGQEVSESLQENTCLLVDWTDVGPTYWPNYASCIDSTIEQSGSDVTSTFENLAGLSKWAGGVLAPNGFVYGIPFGSTSVLKIDPSDDTISTFGSLSGTSKWFGGVLAPNGFIYGIPYNSAPVLKIDPSDDSVSTFGSFSGFDKWVGGVLAPNGFIYGIPFYSTSVLKIDSSDDTPSTFGELAGSGAWFGGVLAPNGFIYGIPYNSTSVLKIDPSDDSVSTFGELAATSNKWRGGVLAPNGFIYGIPYGSTSILKIDPSDDTVSTFENLSGSNKWTGGVLAPNGDVYGMPFESTTVLKISPDSAASLTDDVILSAYFNKL